MDGKVHTNGLENLFRYLDEQAFRFNNRKEMTDADRFELVMGNVFGKRLTWNQLTGKTADGETQVN